MNDGTKMQGEFVCEVNGCNKLMINIVEMGSGVPPAQDAGNGESNGNTNTGSAAEESTGSSGEVSTGDSNITT